MEDGPTTPITGAERDTYAALTRDAGLVCASCPVRPQCLYDAVVRHDVAGFVAGTTARQRQEIRRLLSVTVVPEDLDTLAGVLGGHRQVNHDEVVRLRRTNPQDSMETIAARLGCSLSTVKRHLRRARAEATSTGPAPTRQLPTLAQVLDAFARVTGRLPARMVTPLRSAEPAAARRGRRTAA